MSNNAPNKAKLCSVKHRLYHPDLPTIRHMDRDDNCMMLPYQHSRTTTSLNKKDFDDFGTAMNKKMSSHCNFWSKVYRGKDEETMKSVVNASLKNAKICEEQHDQDSTRGKDGVTNIEHNACDGNILEKQVFPLINPVGVFRSEEKGICFEGYPIRQNKASINHRWVEDL